MPTPPPASRRALAAMLVLFMIALAPAATLAQDSPQPIDPADYDHPVRVACVGDSITYGAGVKDRDHGTYPVQLGEMLGDGWVTQNFGVNGATLLRHGDLPYVDQDAYDDALAWKPDVVLIMLGTNDSKPKNWDKKDQFPADYRRLIHDFQQANPDARIELILPVPAFPGRWGISDKVIHDEVIPMTEKIARSTSLPTIDLYTPLKPHGDLFADTVHPNAEGSGIMAAHLAHALTGKPVDAFEPAPANAG